MHRAMVCWLFCLLVSSPLQAQTFPGANFGAIPDGGSGTPPNYGAPRDVTFAVAGTQGTVTSAVVSFSAAHGFVGDLKVTLVAPNGKPHVLFARTGATAVGGFGTDSNLLASNTYRFGDAFASNWWTAAVLANLDVPSTDARSVVAGGAGVTNPPPVTSINASFLGIPANGTWTLRFEDGAATDTGNVTAASLTLTMAGITRTVTTTADAGAGSLRAAMTSPGAGDLIVFATPLFDQPQTIELLSALPGISVNLGIAGPGADLLTIRRHDNAPDFGIFEIESGLGGVSLSGTAVSNGRSTGDGCGINTPSPLTLAAMHIVGNRCNGNGGGVHVNGTRATVVNSTINGNQAGQGGGIFIYQGNQIQLLNSTVSGNRAAFGGGIGILSDGAPARLELGDSTVTGNVATSATGGIDVVSQNAPTAAAIAALRNSIVAHNLPDNLFAFAAAGSASISSEGFNLSDNWNGITTTASDRTADARLGPLALHGGRTPTHLPLAGSPALDGGNSAGAGNDQRGQPRVFEIASIANPTGGSGADIGAVEARPIVVSNDADDGAGSLRAAIAAAAGNGAGQDDILFDPAFFNQARTINLVSVLPDLGGALAIAGPGANQLTVRRSGAALYRIFAVPGGATVSLSGLTVANGDSAAEGGGVRNAGLLSISRAVISGNHANGGGGIYSPGRLYLHDSTLSGNSASFDGGGLYQVGTALVVNTTVSGNSAGLGGGGVSNGAFSPATSTSLTLLNSSIVGNSAAPGTGGGVEAFSQGVGSVARLRIRNSLLAANTPINIGALDILGGGPTVVSSRGFNLSTDNAATLLNQPSDRNSAVADLLPLALNGGATPTHAMLAGSAALDAGNNDGSGVQFDQRGAAFVRVVDLPLANAAGSDGSDIGAYEAATTPQAQTIFANGFEGN